MTSYRIRAIRLVNFHNFVDEQIEVRDGGHLFLLGDNGSGKTTILDAIHLVLAGREPELNAAARVGGRRDEGRTLQGIVLRHDRELGLRNPGGAIAYAALELVDGDGRALCLGIGVEATTLEARVGTWGFVVARPVAEVRLVDDAGCPLDREALRRQLGAGHVHAPLSGYRKELARRLFGGEARHDEATRFWAMAKAYREIVAGARDFAGLFERLMPLPDGVVFTEILATLRAIDELEVTLQELEAQRAYVAGLAERVSAVAVAREAVARYRWLECQRERDEAESAARHADRSAVAARAEAARARLDGEASRLRSEAAEEVVRRAASADAAGLLSLVRDADARRRALTVDRERAEAVSDDCRRAHRRACEQAETARADLAASAGQAAGRLRSAADVLAGFPGALPGVAALVEALARIVPRATPSDPVPGDVGASAGTALARSPDEGAPLPSLPAAPSPSALLPLPEVGVAGREADELRAICDRALLDARVREQQAAAQQAKRVAATDALTAPPSDDAPGPCQTARRALAAAGIAARPLYELLEPATDTTSETLAAVESLVGEAVLTALVVTDDERERARALVATVAPAVRVVVATCDQPLPPWCAAAFDASADDARARAILAAALAQPAELGEVAPPAAGAITLRGLGHQISVGEPQWLGASARQRQREARTATARAAVVRGEHEYREAARAVERASARAAAASGLERALTAVATTVTAAWHAAARARDRAQLTADACAQADARTAAVAARLDELEHERVALRARAAAHDGGGEDLATLDERLADLRRGADAARSGWRRHLAAEASATAEAARHATEAAVARARADELAHALVGLDRDLRAAMAAAGQLAPAGDDALAHHVRVTLRGDSFRSLASLRQRIADEERDGELAAAELEGDGSRGVRNLGHAGRFGFVYDRERNRLVDRRGQPVAGVHAELVRAIEDQRSVVNDKTRALMDTLVMGSLARHLQAQVHHLHETVRGINRVLRDLRFGATAYQFDLRARPDRAEVIDLVQRLSILDEDSRTRFRAWIDGRLDELRAAGDEVPALLDYRRWFELTLRMSTSRADGVELTERLRLLGSGGEQGVPNYLLVLSLAKLMFDAGGASARPLLFDEAFYGIDAGRRDQLLRLATALDLQLVVASPDQDGATPAVRHATTLFVIKDDHHDVHLAPYHYWHHADQADLFAPPPDLAAAACRTPPTTPAPSS